MSRLLRMLAVALSVFVVMTSPAEAAKRVALVVGNDQYESLPKLQKAVADARAVGAALADIGFEVVVGENLSRRDMNRKLADLEKSIAPGDRVFFFYAGHGVAIGGENVLLPTDMPSPQSGEEELVREEGFSVDSIVRRVQRRGAEAVILVLDACRNNPFEVGGTRDIGATRGLVKIDAPSGVFVLFSAGIGQTALDRMPNDADQNSVFTRRLVPALRTPGLSHVAIAKRVQREVGALAATIQHKQQPAYYDQIDGEIVLNGTAAVALGDSDEEAVAMALEAQRQAAAEESKVLEAQKKAAAEEARALEAQKKTAEEEAKALDAQKKALEAEARAVEAERKRLQSEKEVQDTQVSRGIEQTPNEVAPPAIGLTGVYRVHGTNPNGTKYRGMVALKQENNQFNLTWWIANNVFHGSGHLAGDELVIDWGTDSPVIYTLESGGILKGEWANRSGVETLKPAAIAAADEVALTMGTYVVEGKNPNGSRYKGTLKMERNGNGYQLYWKVGKSAYRGKGTFVANVLTVEWGSSTPVVYALRQDGRLVGLWEAGAGEETLIPE